MLGKAKRKEKERIPSGNKWAIITLVVIATLALAGILFFVGLVSTVTVFDDTDTHAQGAEAITNINRMFPASELPITTTDAYFYRTEWIDWFAQLRMTLPEDDARTWLEEIDFCVDVDELEISDSSFSDDSLDWWQSNADTHRTGRCGDNPYYRIWLEENSNGMWTIFLQGNTV